MNNITFPEMDSVTSSASDNVLNTLDQNFNIFKAAQPVLPVSQPVLPVSQAVLPVSQAVLPVSQSTPKSVTFNNNVQQKTLPPKSILVQTSQSAPQPASQPKSGAKSDVAKPDVAKPDVATKVDTEVKLDTVISKDLIKFGKYVCPKKTLMLVGLLVIVGVALYFATKPENKNKKNKKENEEDEE